MSKPVNLFASLRRLERTSRKTGAVSSKVSVQFTADDVWFNPDEKLIAKRLAAEIASVVKAQLMRGNNPEGKALPSLDDDTQKWRAAEYALGARGGEADPRFKDAKKRAAIKAKYQRDYTPQRMGKATFTPQPGGARGVVSGLLVRSVRARPLKDGKTFIVDVAGIRGTPRPGERQSAIETVLAGMPMWSAAAMNQPEIRKAMQEAANGMVSKDLKSLLREAQQAFRNLQQLGETLDDDGGNEG
ncbi:MAG TPA: hypothetical protein VEJ18_19195 [Planctomycetota bacterium]|nr:hypothetical protein [Planctomycetota bacterium]